MQFEKIAQGFGALEAPRVDASGNLWFTDILFGGVYRRTPDGSLIHFVKDRLSIGGIVFNQDGRLICSGKGGLIFLDPATGATEPLLTEFDGQPIDDINDLQTDDAGSLYGGTLDYASLAAGKAPTYGTLFRLDPRDRITVLSRDVAVTNGIGMSPDRRFLYHVDSGSGIWRYELSATRAVRERLQLVAQRGFDGLAVDAEGHLWVANFESPEVVRYSPEGREDRRLRFAARAVLSLVFGGSDLRDLYVVTADDFANPVKREAAIFRARSPVPGQALPLARF